MAEKKAEIPLFDMTAEGKKMLEDIKGEIETAENNLNAMEKIGLDVSRLREKINWAKNAREIMLKEIK